MPGRMRVLILGVVSAFVPLIFTSCSISKLAGVKGLVGPEGEKGEKSSGTWISGKKKGGAQLWAENCGRCHNLRPPTMYSQDQWEVAVNHMRIRAELTANEARKIAEFLKSAN